MKIISLTTVLTVLFTMNIMAQGIKNQEGNIIPEDKFTTTQSGLKYVITTQGKGEKAKAGDKVIVHYNGRFLNDSVFDSSIKRGQPFTFTLGKGQVIKGWDEVFQILNKGDKAVIVLPPEIAYGSQERGGIPANSTLIFDVELIDIKHQIEIKAYNTAGKDTLTTKSGLKYIKVKEGKGKHARKKTRVTVHYTGYFTDGRIFDSSVKRGEPLKFELGVGQVIKGWDEGLQLMREGDKFRLLIPYELAYGEEGHQRAIPPKSDLIFDVELIEVAPIKQIEPYKVDKKDTITTESGLKYIEVAKGRGIQATAGSKVKVHYTGFFEDGKIFDSSVKRGEPIEFVVGRGQVIKGWDEGILLMHQGDKFKMLIPYKLGYGEKGYPGAIPPKSNLIFDVELIDVAK